MVTSLITKVILLRRSESIPGYLLEGVRGTKGFSLTDLKDVYYYIAVNVDSRQYAAFVHETNIWDKAFKNGPSKICGRQPLKNFTLLSIVEYFVPYISGKECRLDYMDQIFH